MRSAFLLINALFTQVLVASEFVSIVLALILVYLFAKAHKLMRFTYLIGLLLGFLFLAFSYVFLGLFLILKGNDIVLGFFLWLRLVSQTCGFAFIAFSYYFSLKAGRTTRIVLVMITLASIVAIFLVFGALVIAPPFLQLPHVHIADDCFRVVNLCLLGYTIYRIIRQFELSSETLHSLIWAPTAFSLLWLDQYSLFIWGIDGSETAFVIAHITRLASLILFIRIYYWSRRTQKLK
jgi:hypothetical protein